MRANRKSTGTYIFLLTLGILYFQNAVFSQSTTSVVTGTVISSENNQPLSGVSVVIKGSTTGTATDAQGSFRLSAGGSATLIFTYAGFGSVEEAVNNKTTINVTLSANSRSLEDVVVIGYSTVRRRDLTGSVSSVNARQLRDIPVNSAAEALSGRLAGVQVQSTEGAPGADVRIRVRGGGSISQDNSPLYIIDGVQVENGISTLSPQDIESIDVLKDASTTAIYGARGANGVVIITTKGGRNTRTTITYNGFVGFRKLANKLDLMSPHDFVLYQYERSRGSAADSATFAGTYGTTIDTLANYKNVPFVDWQEEMFGRRALMQTHNLSLSGGSATTQYNLSLTSNTEQGIMLLSGFDRKLANFKFDHSFSSKLRVGFNTRYNSTTVTGAGTSSEGSSSTNNLRQSVRYRPLLLRNQDVDDYDPAYADETNANSLSLVNPLLLNQASYRKGNTGVLNLNTYIDLKLTRFLTLRSTFGYDVSNNVQNAFDDTLTNSSKLVGLRMPIANIATTTRTTLNNSNVLTYSNAGAQTGFSENNRINVLVGHEVYENKIVFNSLETRLFPVGISPERAFGNMNLGTPQKPVSTENLNKLLSFFSRVNYSYGDKYLLALSVRADGSTKFAPGKKWSYFPSGSLAWRVSKEKFMEGLDPAISDLKLRISYGEAGNNRIDNFLFLTQFNTNTQYGLNDQLITGFSPVSLSNENLKWETTVSKNLGLDAGFLNNRLQFSVDVYNNTTTDLLVAVPIPTTSGYQSQIQNVGSTSNKGVEFQISGTPVQRKDLSWTANFNMSFNKNKVESLGQYQKFYLQNSGWAFSNSPADYIVRVGDPVGSMWGLVSDGFYKLEDFDYNDAASTYTLKRGVPVNSGITSTIPQPGVLKFRDLNGDTVINDLDRTIIGNANPKFFGGLNQQVTYKNFDLSMFINFQYGNDVYNANKLEFTSGYTPNANMLAINNNRWRTVDENGNRLQRVVTVNNVQTIVGASPAVLAKVNANATLWSPSQSSTSFVVHSWAIEDGSFVRINNMTLGYTFPATLLKRAKIQRLRVYGTVNNVAIFTNYSGYDPEVSTRRSNPVTPGVDYSAYPRSRSFLVGVNLSL